MHAGRFVAAGAFPASVTARRPSPVRGGSAFPVSVASGALLQRALQTGGLVIPKESRLPPLTVQAYVLPLLALSVT